MRILIISRYFPPFTNTRSIQIGKLVNALADQDLDILVLAGYQMYQESDKDNGAVLFNINRNIRIHYIPDNKFTARKYNLIGRVIEKAFFELSSLGLTSWIYRANKYANMLVKLYKPDLILTSSTPFESHIVGYNLRKLYNLPWIISLSDPLIYRSMPYPYNNDRLFILSFYKKILYKRILNNSDVIHMYSKYGFSLISKFIDKNNKIKYYTIPHIGDEYADSQHNVQLKYHDKIVFVGHLKKELIPDHLLPALRQALSELKGTFSGLICVGKVCNEFRKKVNVLGLENCVQFINRVPHKEALNIMKQSGVLLVLDEFVNGMSPILVSKIGEYAMSGRPILAITPQKSALRDYLKDYGGGIAVDDEKDELIKAAKIFFTENNYIKSNNLAKHFFPENVGKEYAKMFKYAIDKQNISV
jgi:glycosyltransferase involved in cell wall biosynthesis